MESSVGAYEAKTHFSGLLDRVERGDAVTITRNGRPVARLVPFEMPPAHADAGAVVEQFRAFREELRRSGVKPFTTQEIIALIQEGRKY